MTAPIAFTIRPFYYPTDYPAAYALWQTAGRGIHAGRSDTPEEIVKKLQRDPDLFLVAEAEGQLIGTVIGGYDGRRGMIYHLAVAQPYRRAGVANALMDAVEARLRSKGCLKAYLLLLHGNDSAASFYAQRGWQVMDNVSIYSKEL